jgi:hypothetical protein
MPSSSSAGADRAATRTGEHGEAVTLERALRVSFLSLLSAAVLGLGWLMQPFTPKRQALHDFTTRTVVLRGRLQPVGDQTAPGVKSSWRRGATVDAPKAGARYRRGWLRISPLKLRYGAETVEIKVGADLEHRMRL